MSDKLIVKLNAKYPGLIDRLGKEADSELAEEFVVHPKTISNYRKNLGIKRSTGEMSDKLLGKLNAKYPGLVDRLGKETDAELAEEFVVHPGTISNYRKALGIKGRLGRPPRDGGMGSREGMEARYPGLYDALGVVPSVELANKYNLSRARINQLCKLIGVSGSTQPRTKKEEVQTFRTRAFDFLCARYEEQNPNASVAQLLDYTPSAISSWRRGTGQPTTANIVRLSWACGMQMLARPDGISLLEREDDAEKGTFFAIGEGERY